MDNLNLKNQLIEELNSFFNTFIVKIFDNKNHLNFKNLLEEIKNLELNDKSFKKYIENINELKNNDSKIFITQNSLDRNKDLMRLMKIKEKLNEIEENSLNYKIFFNEIVYNFNNSKTDIINYPEFKINNTISESTKIFLNNLNELISENNNFDKIKNDWKNDYKNKISDLTENLNNLKNELKIYKKKDDLNKNDINHKMNVSDSENLSLSNYCKEKEKLTGLLNTNEQKIQYINDELNKDNLIKNLKEEIMQLNKIIENYKEENKFEKYNVVYSFRDLFLNKSNISNKINNSSFINKNTNEINNSNIILNNLINQLVLILKDIINDYKILKKEIDNYKININTSFIDIFNSFKLKLNIESSNKIKFDKILKYYNIDKLNYQNLNYLINKLIENDLQKINYELIKSENENLKDSYLLLLSNIKNNKSININEFSRVSEEEYYFLSKEGNNITILFKEFLSEYNKLKNHYDNLDKFYNLMIDLKEKNDNDENILIEIQSIIKMINLDETLEEINNKENFENSIINNLKLKYFEEINNLKIINDDNIKNKNNIKEKILNLREMFIKK